MQRVEERSGGKVLLALDDLEDRIPETRDLVDPRRRYHPFTDLECVPDAGNQGRAAHPQLHRGHQHGNPDIAIVVLPQPPIRDHHSLSALVDRRLRVREVVTDDTQRVVKCVVRRSGNHPMLGTGDQMSISVIRTADDGLRALREHADELARWQNSALNESDTRSKIIDVLLLQVLGWDEASITREDRTVNGRYRDYVVQNERTAFVLEAKRAGRYFEMPVVATREAARDGVLAQSRDFKPAIAASKAGYSDSAGMSSQILGWRARSEPIQATPSRSAAVSTALALM